MKKIKLNQTIEKIGRGKAYPYNSAVKGDPPVYPAADTVDIPLNEDEDIDRIAPNGDVW